MLRAVDRHRAPGVRPAPSRRASPGSSSRRSTTAATRTPARSSCVGRPRGLGVRRRGRPPRVAGLDRPVVDEPPDRRRAASRRPGRCPGRRAAARPRPVATTIRAGADPVEDVAGVDGHEPALVDRRARVPARARSYARRRSRGRPLVDERATLAALAAAAAAAAVAARGGRRRSRARRRAGARCRSGASARRARRPCRGRPRCAGSSRRPATGGAAGSSCGSRSRPA